MAITIASGNRLTPARFNALIPLVARKTADETVNNSAVQQDDNDLFLPVAANASYLLTLRFVSNCTTTADLKMSWSFPSGLTATMDGIAYDGTSTLLLFGGLNQSTLAVFGGLGADRLAVVTGNVFVGATAGTLRWRWAQNVAEASNTIVRAGSSLMLHRYA